MAGQCDILFNSFLMGLRMRTFNKAQSGRFTIVLLLIFALSMVVYYFSNGLPIKLSPTYKYSPNLLYILYGMFICGVFWTIRDLLKRLINYKITRIIENTVWIYLYYIPLLLIPVPFSWFVKYMDIRIVYLLLFCIDNTFL